MPGHLLIDYVPLWGVFLITVAVVAIAFEVGFRIGAHHKKKISPSKEVPIGSIVGASLGLLAFILAFTFSMASTRFEEKKELVLDEVNILQSLYLRANLFTPEDQAQIHSLMREYLEVRLSGLKLKKYMGIIAKSENIQQEIWQVVEQIAKRSPDSTLVGLLIESANNMINIHIKRVALGRQGHIPEPIWNTLYFITFLAIASMGYHLGLAGIRGFTANFSLILAFSAMMTLIADLDRPQEGILKVSQQPTEELLNWMKMNDNIR